MNILYIYIDISKILPFVTLFAFSGVNKSLEDLREER